jgi:hypothetical protein
MSYQARLEQIGSFFRRKYRIIFLTVVTFAAMC